MRSNDPYSPKATMITKFEYSDDGWRVKIAKSYRVNEDGQRKDVWVTPALVEVSKRVSEGGFAVSYNLYSNATGWENDLAAKDIDFSTVFDGLDDHDWHGRAYLLWACRYGKAKKMKYMQRTQFHEEQDKEVSIPQEYLGEKERVVGSGLSGEESQVAGIVYLEETLDRELEIFLNETKPMSTPQLQIVAQGLRRYRNLAGTPPMALIEELMEYKLECGLLGNQILEYPGYLDWARWVTITEEKAEQPPSDRQTNSETETQAEKASAKGQGIAKKKGGRLASMRKRLAKLDEKTDRFLETLPSPK